MRRTFLLLALFLFAGVARAQPADAPAVAPAAPEATATTGAPAPSAPEATATTGAPAPAAPEAAPPSLLERVDAIAALEGARALLDEVLALKRKDKDLPPLLAHLEALRETGTDGQRWLALRVAEEQELSLDFAPLAAGFSSTEQALVDVCVRLGVKRYPDDTLTSLLEFLTPSKRLALWKTLDTPTQVRLVERMVFARPGERQIILALLEGAAALSEKALERVVGLSSQPGIGPAIIDLLRRAGRPGEGLLATRVGALVRQRGGPDAASFVRNAAVLGEPSRFLIEPFFASPDDAVVLAALDALTALTPRDRPVGAPLELLESSNPEVQLKAIFVAARGLDHDAVPVLERLLGAPVARTRAMAAWALAHLGEARSEVPLINAFRRESVNATDENLHARVWMLEALSRVGSTSSIPVLINAMARREQRDPAIRGVARFGREAVPFLTFILQSRDESREAAVAEAIVRIGRAASVDVSKLLKHPSRHVREIGVSLLTIVGDEESAPLVRQFLKDEGIPETQVLQSLRLYYFAMRDVFLEALRSGEPESRMIALKTILNMKDWEVLPAVEELLDQEKDPAIRHAALKVLWYLDAPGVDKRLGEVIQYEQPAIKLEALRAIRLLMGPEALPTVANLLTGETREVEREAAQTILRMTGVQGLDSPSRVNSWFGGWKARQGRADPTPDESGVLTLGAGATLAYEIHGSSGPYLLVVPGGPDLGMDYLRRWIAPLRDVRRVVLIDPRGRGRGRDPSALAFFDVTTEAADLSELIGKLGADQVDVLAHGFGNFVALRLTQIVPRRVGRVALIGPPVPVGERVIAELKTLPERLDGPWKDDYAFLLREGDRLARAPLRRAIDRVFLRLYFRNSEWVAMLPSLHGDPLLRTRLVRALKGVDLRDALRASERPLLVMQAKADIWSADTLEWYVELARANRHVRITTFGSSGHFPFIEEKGRFLETLRDFLRAK